MNCELLAKDHYTTYYSGHLVTYLLGVGILVSQKVKAAVISFELGLINVHASIDDTVNSEAVEGTFEACHHK